MMDEEGLLRLIMFVFFFCTEVRSSKQGGVLKMNVTPRIDEEVFSKCRMRDGNKEPTLRARDRSYQHILVHESNVGDELWAPQAVDQGEKKS